MRAGATAAATAATAAAAQPQPARPSARPSPSGPAPRVAGTRRAGLRLVPPMRSGAPRAPFVVLLATLLAGGLAGLLVLHTALAEDSFRLQDLKNRSAALAAQEQALGQQVAKEASPRRLAEKAEALGMVRSVNPAFIRLADGQVLGKPRPGKVPPPPVPSAAPGAVAGTTPTTAATAAADADTPADGDRDGRERDRDRDGGR